MAKKAIKQLVVGKFVSTDKIQLRAPARRGSMYDSIYDSLAKLKKGQSFVIPVPKGVNVRTLQNRVNAAIRRGPVDAPAGCVFRKNTTVKGDIAVSCLGADESLARESRHEARKAKLKAKRSKKVVKAVAVKAAA